MGEIRTVTTLEAKRLEIRNAIAEYERRLAQARADLAHVTACISIFDASETTPSRIPAYADMRRVFGHHGLGKLILQALAQKGPMGTTELALYAAEAKGLDTGDAQQIKVIRYRAMHVLSQARKRGKVIEHSKRGRTLVWALPPLPINLMR